MRGIKKGHFLQESHTQMTNFWHFKKKKPFFLKILCCIIYLFLKKLNCGKLSVIAKMLPFFHHPRVIGVRPLQCIWIESLGTDLPNKKGASRVGKKKWKFNINQCGLTTQCLPSFGNSSFNAGTLATPD